MEIPSYQIHNVLKVYSRQISQSRISGRNNGLNGKNSVDRINISAEAKRQGIIDKVASDIVERITRFGPQDDVDHEIVGKLQEELGQPIEFKSHEKPEFVYNTIDNNNQKVKNTLSMENSDFVMQRLEQLAKNAVDEKME